MFYSKLFKSVLTIYLVLYLTVSVESEASLAYRTECLRIHNIMRERHGAPLLKINLTLNVAAEEWAKKIGDEAVTSGVEFSMVWKRAWNIGENIGGLENPNDNAITKLFDDGGYPPRIWYREILDHDFRILKFRGRTGHFTQIIWAETTDIGIGKVVTSSGQFIVVCFYYPAGNWDYEDSFGRNVLKPTSGEANSIPENEDFQKYLDD